MAIPIRALDNAILTLLADFGPARIDDHRAVDWASATFIGARHEIQAVVRIAPRDRDTPIIDAIATRLANLEAALPGHLLADMILAEHAVAEDELHLAIEALTLIDG